MDAMLLCIFISHAFPHDRDRQLFHQHLEKAWPKGGVYRVLEPSTRHRSEDDNLKEFLRRQIAMADVVLVVAARYVVAREWMLFEIETARNLGKPIILVRKPNTRCPKRLVELCGVHPTELDTLRWKIKRLLSPSRLEDLKQLEISQALYPTVKPKAKTVDEYRHPWLASLGPLSVGFPVKRG